MSRYKIIYGEYKNEEKRAAEIVAAAISDNVNYTVAAQKASETDAANLGDENLVIIGTPDSNSLLKKLCDDGKIKLPDDNQGYTIKVSADIFKNRQTVIIAGSSAASCMYGAADFAAYYIPQAEFTNDHAKYYNELFGSEKLPECEISSAPSVKWRGLWTWGHVIYDYRGYIDNMAKLKLNVLIIWNDAVPVNIDEVIAYAHENGIKIILGYAWGWDSSADGKIDISDENQLKNLENSIVEKYKTQYAQLGCDGIYFQSFTETTDETDNGVIIADAAVRLVNGASKRLLAEYPALELMFGLHATSVAQKLEYIKKTDSRVWIVWEDCGAFPYAYVPDKIKDFDKTCEFTESIAALRGKDEKFGAVTKGMVCLDWKSFEHQPGSFVMGRFSQKFIEKRTAEKEKLWKYIQSYWIKNAHFASDMIKTMLAANKNTLITALVEDGMFENRLWFPVAVYAEMMWNSDECAEEILKKVAQRPDVNFAG